MKVEGVVGFAVSGPPTYEQPIVLVMVSLGEDDYGEIEVKEAVTRVLKNIPFEIIKTGEFVPF